MFRRQGLAPSAAMFVRQWWMSSLLPNAANSASEPSSLLRFRFQFVELPGILHRFSEKPLAERHDFRQPGRGLRADDPVPIGNGHRGIERTYKPAADQIPCGKRGACERDALTVDCSVDRHACLVENRAARRVDTIDTGKVEPLAPAFPIADVQERETAEIRWRMQRLAAVQELRTAHRKQLLGAQTSD